jgi:hypothetical protein
MACVLWRSLLNALVRLPWHATDKHPVLQALRSLQDLYAREQRHLPIGTRMFLGRVWQGVLDSPDRERAFCAFEERRTLLPSDQIGPHDLQRRTLASARPRAPGNTGSDALTSFESGSSTCRGSQCLCWA